MRKSLTTKSELKTALLSCGATEMESGHREPTWWITKTDYFNETLVFVWMTPEQASLFSSIYDGVLIESNWEEPQLDCYENPEYEALFIIEEQLREITMGA